MASSAHASRTAQRNRPSVLRDDQRFVELEASGDLSCRTVLRLPPPLRRNGRDWPCICIIGDAMRVAGATAAGAMTREGDAERSESDMRISRAKVVDVDSRRENRREGDSRRHVPAFGPGRTACGTRRRGPGGEA